jgi:hypothetical protein
MKTKSTVSLLFAAALALPVLAWAQMTPVTTQTLVNGLHSGRPVIITTPLANGYQQTVSFVAPTGPMAQSRANRMIDLAQQDLAARGIEQPTALQIAVTLLGGTLPTPNGDVQVPGLLPKSAGKAPRPSHLQVFYTGPYV